MGFQPVYVVDGARTPFLKGRNAPGPFSASDLAVQICPVGALLVKRQGYRQPIGERRYDAADIASVGHPEVKP